MRWPDQAVWLPLALLLLWVPGCSSISGPTSMTGTLGSSLIVQCSYEEQLRTHFKYWCKKPCFWKTVETKRSSKEVRNGRVSIRDHPANLTFIVTLENLTEDDAGTYRCGIDTSWLGGYLQDPAVHIVVSVIPATTSAPPANITVTQISTITAGITTTSSSSSPTVPITMGATHSASSQEEFQQSQGVGLQVLLSLLALLLLLLGGSLFLAWRIVHKRVKAGENPKPLRTHSQNTLQGELYYANLELQARTLQGEPTQPRQEEVEYSTVVGWSGEQITAHQGLTAGAHHQMRHRKTHPKVLHFLYKLEDQMSDDILCCLWLLCLKG
ncbi:CMRF35-like molecule 8 isoform X1 [Prionailurus viverrinus]|uniref:CMRF35-like molecule 8 isoform X1 n=1 Tax=Prionailurus viverrinus TaxID=61388 RepID=UPI001FF183A1|nr:CMRF35-like molecule 8 isoform X1 [Prionailurus viverrinus]XP_047689240.1 CMRF35-like molecule 8 isoform X1 [Prionailurus viverrinus]XP_047689241.1 CMRF35-like molecule 8 isoform X1 [Prionailurus viverrinus]